MTAALNATGRPILFSMCEWGVSSPWLYAQTVRKPTIPLSSCIQLGMTYRRARPLLNSGSQTVPSCAFYEGALWEELFMNS